MKMVFALGMSSPLSMIVVASSMSYFWLTKFEHHVFEFVLGHLAVGDADGRLGHDLPQACGENVNILHAIVNEENLPAAIQFPQHGVADQLGIEAVHAGFDRQTVLGRRFQVRDVAQPEQAHVQRARDGRGGHRQHIDDLPQGLQSLFHIDAETLLLVDDQAGPSCETARPAGRADACR